MSALTLTALVVLIGTPCLAWALTALWLWLDPVETRALDWPEVERWEERGWDDDARAVMTAPDSMDEPWHPEALQGWGLAEDWIARDAR